MEEKRQTTSIVLSLMIEPQEGEKTIDLIKRLAGEIPAKIKEVIKVESPFPE